MTSALTHLECSLCKKQFQAGKVHNLCDCGGPLLVRYDMESTRRAWNRDRVAEGPTACGGTRPCCRRNIPNRLSR